MKTHFLFLFIEFHLFSSIFCYYYDNNCCNTVQDYYHRHGNPNCFNNIDFQLNVPQLVLKYTGSRVKAYTIQTEDGYLLTMYRIPRKNPKGVVLLQHPIITGSIVYVFDGNHSLALTLWRNGYDVWMNNARGTSASEKHIKLPMYDYKYWNWSFHEVSLYEIPKEIELIRKKTNYSHKIIYYGHSLGSTVGLAYSALFPKQSEEDVKVFIYAGVTCYYKHNVSVLATLPKLLEALRTLTSYFKIGYVIPMRDIFVRSYQLLVRQYPVFLQLGHDLSTLFNGQGNYTSPAYLNMDSILVLENFSWKMVFHLFQLMRIKTRFQQYDYGPEQNLKVYGTELPALYPIENITVPTLLIYSVDDILTSPKDTLLLYDQLPEKVKKHGILKLKGLNHIDYFFSHYKKELFNDYFLEFINKL